MKNFLLSLLTFFCVFVNAQLDTDHWFAPIAADAGTTNLQSYLYLSTNETTPFSVQIFNNNTLYRSVQISKGNPAEINIPQNFLLATNRANIMATSNMGMNVKGPKKFFANYRFTVQSHGEIITSKGLAGLGKIFYAAMAPNTASNYYINSTIGITATEDNTTVVVSGYNPNVVFSDGTSSPTKTFTLNKGQSYILDAISSDSPYNLNGLIGAKIEATNPISVTNGNFNAIYTTQNFTNNDILMDQSVPVDRLGKDFVIVKGNGPVTSGMEAVLVVATEDNTTVSINGANTGITLNTGQYFIIPGTNYVNHGNNNYNMGVSTSKNAYVYQLLAGVDNISSTYATGGFNYIPPLSCFLPNKVDEIGFIEKIGTTSYNTKLNILTQTGANVTVNNNPIATIYGPYPVTGNPNWVSYSIPNITGNITVNSTKSVTAGIIGGNGAIGYGGYFAGFSSVPVITKTGDCLHGIILQVDDSYDQYQWYFNNAPIPGATNYFINPELYGSGVYTCMVTKNNCESKLTNTYDYRQCPPIKTVTYNIGSCNTQVITPTFSTSTQNVVNANTQVVINPTSGTAVVNPTTGQITYTPNPTLATSSTDTFTYYIEGNGNPADFEYVRVIINIDVLQTTPATLIACENINLYGNFDLTSAIVTTNPGATITYYTDAALTIPIASPTIYASLPGVVYAKVVSNFGCIKSSIITLQTTPSPRVNATNFNGSFCDDNFDGIINVNLNTISQQIVPNSGNFNIRYYANQADANTGNNNTLPTNWSYNTNTTIYIRVDSNNNCPPAISPLTFSIGNKINLIANAITAQVCDQDLSGSEVVNLNDYLNQFTIDPTATATYYTTLANAQNATNAISSQQVITSTGTYYVRITSANFCPNIATLTITLKSGKKSEILQNKTVCPNATTTLNAGTGFTSYLWSTGETTPSITVGEGTYFVDLGFNGCVYRQTVIVTTTEAPVIKSVSVNGATATINVSGGTPPYQYSINGIDYQSSNIFTGLPRGTYQIFVKSNNGCAPVTKQFLIINLLNAITPNGDGYNDVLNYSELKIKENVNIQIFDRYGAIVYQSKDNQYIWNGKLGNRPLPTATYWYLITWVEPDTKLPVSYSGWILLKNRE